MKTRRNETAKMTRNHLPKSRLLLVTAVVLNMVTAAGFASLLRGTISSFAVTPLTVYFDFDIGSPPPLLYQNTPFDYTSDWVTAHFSSPSDSISPAFSVQNDQTIPPGYNLSMFAGQFLYDNQATRDYLDIKFNAQLYSLNLTFATIEPHGGPGVEPCFINLTAYVDSVGTTPVGSVIARGVTSSEQNAQGTLSFNSSGQIFNLVRIYIPPNQPPFYPTDFFVDNIVIIATPAPDTTPPVTTINLSGTLGSQGWYTSDVAVSLSATDDMSGVNKTEYSFNNVTWTTYTTPFTITSQESTTVYYRSTDNVGNIEAVKTRVVKIDKTLPTGSIIINGGNATTNSHSVTLTLTQNDAVSGVSQVRYSNDGVWDTELWEAPSPTKAWTLTAGNGTKTVYYQIKDNAGLISLTYQDSIIVEMPSGPDVAVINVAPSKNVVGQGFCVGINITVQNQGDFTETFPVNVYADLSLPIGDEVLIGTQTVANLLVGETRTFTIRWNTSVTTPKGNYTTSAVATPVPSEVDTNDNTLTNGFVIVAMIGDITGPTGWPDGKCDIRDLALVAKHFGQNVPPAPPNCDITGPIMGEPDNKIDVRDIATAAKNYGKIDP